MGQGYQSDNARTGNDCQSAGWQATTACYAIVIGDLIDLEEQAQSCYEAGNFADAAEQFYRAWEASSCALREPVVLKARAAQGMAASYARQKKFFNAYGWYGIALEAYANLFGSDHDFYLDCMEARVHVGNLLNKQYPQEPAKL